MPTYRTPGVYVEEKSTLPPSVAEVSTAIPAFIGYTQKRPSGETPAVARITTLLEYEQLFGGPATTKFSLEVDAAGKVSLANGGTGPSAVPEFLLYYQVCHYFKNGGGACYIVSVGNYGSMISKDDFQKGLDRLALEDEPTLILLTDAVNLTTAGFYHELCQAALAQCQSLGDRFAIFDIKPNAAANTEVQAFRDGIGTKSLAYGAAYYPYLETTLSFAYAEKEVAVQTAYFRPEFAANSFDVTYPSIAGTKPQVQLAAAASDGGISFEVKDCTLTIKIKDGTLASAVVAAWNKWADVASNNAAGWKIAQLGDGSAALKVAATPTALLNSFKLSDLQSVDTGTYNRAKAFLATQCVTLPPSGAVAGIYSATDRERGVWKAPANISVAAVTGPVRKISDDMQDGLNVDATAGKSINAIRAFSGKGTLVWGARTLAGNDNEWRYVSVRRLFIMIEESARKSTAFAVFEPNDLTTWLKVKGMIDSFLYGLWERGALAGSKAEQAYFVNVGLGKTMTTQDILEGRMIVEIGIAAVRPAEFIILRFSHKLQET